MIFDLWTFHCILSSLIFDTRPLIYLTFSKKFDIFKIEKKAYPYLEAYQYLNNFHAIIDGWKIEDFYFFTYNNFQIISKFFPIFKIKAPVLQLLNTS